MTLLCIVFSVFMVTAVFSMAEMGAKMERARLMEKHGAISLQTVLNSPTGQTLLVIAVVLFLLVLLAGVLMISSSMNSSVSQRTKFFGMMRCIGMSKKQIIRFVRLEALNWCKQAIPIGILLGIIMTWILCGMLKFGVGQEFATIPLFDISIIGIISGVFMGIITVLIAASSPARRAAKVSPIVAVSGDSSNRKISYIINNHLLKLETKLGIQHAIAAKKNLVLMTSSFALSIILFLTFTVFIDFMGYLMPQSAATADITISSQDNSINKKWLDKLSNMDGVKNIFGRRSTFNVATEFVNQRIPAKTVDIISFGEFDLHALKKDKQLRKGSNLSSVYGQSNYVLATWDKNSPLKIGDKLTIKGKQLEISGLLKNDPFSSDGQTHDKVTIIVSDQTFTDLIGITDYSLLLIQTKSDVKEKDITMIRQTVGSRYLFSDIRNKRTTSTYFAFLFFVYGFLFIITLVAVLNIMNSISMSVSSRIREYGAMRAVGMNNRQMTKMIIAEAATYSVLGCMIGSGLGLLVNKIIYQSLITSHFSYANWHIPWIPIVIILIFVFIATVSAIYEPAKRIKNMSIVENLTNL